MAASLASRVCFLTDIEGNWQYVRSVVRQSSCLRFRDADERELALQDDCVLVFGGDAGDKGDDTLHCYEQLVRLKRQHPDRVVLLAGNRDVNKMRFTSELHDSELPLQTMAKEIRDGPVWVPEEKRTTVPKFLKKLLRFLKKKEAETSGTCDADAGVDDDSAEMDLSFPELEAVNTKVNRLRWMLSYTMGSEGDFERRRAELAAKAGGKTEVSDGDVLDSFVSSVEEGGVIREYLLEGCLAFIIHNTLFVHGGIITTASDGSVVISLGRVPDDDTVYDDVQEWTVKLNEWYQSQLQEWIAQPTWTADHSTRGGNELMSYVLPSYKRSVIMGRHLDKSGKPISLPTEVAASLQASGISRVIVGHTPHGTCPTVIRQPKPATDTIEARFKEVIMCDTSYSDTSSADNRGIAASELILHPDGRVDIHGVLENGRPIRFASNNEPSIIGRLLNDGTRVKAQLADEEDEYLVFKVEKGFDYTYHYRSLAELESIGFVDEDI